jgi:hypothetical protein
MGTGIVAQDASGDWKFEIGNLETKPMRDGQ